MVTVIENGRGHPSLNLDEFFISKTFGEKYESTYFPTSYV